ncbi:hypothetical protein ACFQZC_23585 [Streptacidiphilus monticola]
MSTRTHAAGASPAAWWKRALVRPARRHPQQQRDIRALLRRVWLLIALFATLSLVVVMI